MHQPRFFWTSFNCDKHLLAHVLIFRLAWPVTVSITTVFPLDIMSNEIGVRASQQEATK
jgi:hypothetical protein